MSKLKSIFIDNNGNVKTDAIITFIKAIVTLGIPSIMLKFIQNRSKNYRKYKSYTKNTKRQIFNSLLFPWEEVKLKFGVAYKRLFIKQLNIQNIDDTYKKVKIKKSVNTLFLGKPGSGKTTYLNHLYLSQFTVKKVFYISILDIVFIMPMQKNYCIYLINLIMI